MSTFDTEKRKQEAITNRDFAFKKAVEFMGKDEFEFWSAEYHYWYDRVQQFK